MGKSGRFRKSERLRKPGKLGKLERLLKSERFGKPGRFGRSEDEDFRMKI